MTAGGSGLGPEWVAAVSFVAYFDAESNSQAVSWTCFRLFVVDQASLAAGLTAEWAATVVSLEN